MNNHGDSFAEGQDFNLMRSRWLEQEVIRYLGDLYRAPVDRCWGYMASGSTESNMQSLFFAREHFNEHEKVAIMYSEKAHSSVAKCAYYLKISTFGDLAEKMNFDVPHSL